MVFARLIAALSLLRARRRSASGGPGTRTPRASTQSCRREHANARYHLLLFHVQLTCLCRHRPANSRFTTIAHPPFPGTPLAGALRPLRREPARGLLPDAHHPACLLARPLSFLASLTLPFLLRPEDFSLPPPLQSFCPLREARDTSRASGTDLLPASAPRCDGGAASIQSYLINI